MDFESVDIIEWKEYWEEELRSC